MDLPDNETLRQLAEAEQENMMQGQSAQNESGYPNTYTSTGEFIAPMPTSASEVMAKRDNFFHSCWMRMKQLHLDMALDMTEIELYIANLPIGPEVEEDEPDEDDTIL